MTAGTDRRTQRRKDRADQRQDEPRGSALRHGQTPGLTSPRSKSAAAGSKRMGRQASGKGSNPSAAKQMSPAEPKGEAHAALSEHKTSYSKPVGQVPRSSRHDTAVAEPGSDLHGVRSSRHPKTAEPTSGVDACGHAQTVTPSATREDDAAGHTGKDGQPLPASNKSNRISHARGGDVGSPRKRPLPANKRSEKATPPQEALERIAATGNTPGAPREEGAVARTRETHAAKPAGKSEAGPAQLSNKPPRPGRPSRNADVRLQDPASRTLSGRKADSSKHGSATKAGKGQPSLRQSWDVQKVKGPATSQTASQKHGPSRHLKPGMPAQHSDQQPSTSDEPFQDAAASRPDEPHRPASAQSETAGRSLDQDGPVVGSSTCGAAQQDMQAAAWSQSMIRRQKRTKHTSKLQDRPVELQHVGTDDVKLLNNIRKEQVLKHWSRILSPPLDQIPTATDLSGQKEIAFASASSEQSRQR